MIFDTSKIYFRYKIEDTKTEVAKVIEKFNQITKTFNIDFAKELAKFGIDVNPEKIEFLADPSKSTIIALKIDDYKFDKRFWKKVSKENRRTGKAFYKPNESSMTETNYKFLMNMFDREIPNILLYNLMLLKLDKDNLGDKSGLDIECKQSDLITQLFQSGEYSYVSCSPNVFRAYFGKFAKGINVVSFNTVTSAYCMDEGNQIKLYIDKNKKWLTENECGILLFQDNIPMLSATGTIIDKFEITVESEEVKPNVKISISGSVITSELIHYAHIMRFVAEKYNCDKEDILSINYGGGDFSKNVTAIIDTTEDSKETNNPEASVSISGTGKVE